MSEFFRHASGTEDVSKFVIFREVISPFTLFSRCIGQLFDGRVNVWRVILRLVPTGLVILPFSPLLRVVNDFRKREPSLECGLN